MELFEAKQRFIETWGTLGTEWGISRSMAQIHALLLLAEQPMSADEIMDALQIARGNANMNLRALMDWGLVRKELITGERREYFSAHKDMWTVARQVISHRKKKELEPLFQTIHLIHDINNKDTPEAAHFISVVDDIRLFGEKADKMLSTLTSAERVWVMNTLLKFIR